MTPGFQKVADICNSYCLPESDYTYKDRRCCLNLKDFPQPFFSESHSSY